MSSLILINPCIFDFAAFDLWSKPFGLLTIAGHLRAHGYDVKLIDCMDRSGTKSSLYGTGKFQREILPSPEKLSHIKRNYARYGIAAQAIAEKLKLIKNPSAIMVTSHMTYWYPGVQETIKTARLVHPDVPVILGGTYVKLCCAHAKENSGADLISDSGNIEEIISMLKGIGVYPSGEAITDGCIYPAMDLVKNPGYAVIMSSVGCPFDCCYCASSFLSPPYKRRNPQEAVKEILHWHNSLGVTDFAFYDDALLIDSNQHAVPIFEGILSHGLNIRLHTPNAVHAREISFGLAHIMKRAGMKTIRLGFETADHNRIDKKINTEDFLTAAGVLHEAGFSREELGAYILAGLPDQTPESVETALRLCEKAEIQPFLAEYSPLPHTALWEKAVKSSGYDIENEPLFHNNTLLPCWNDKQRRRMPELKDLAVSIRIRVKQGRTW